MQSTDRQCIFLTIIIFFFFNIFLFYSASTKLDAIQLLWSNTHWEFPNTWYNKYILIVNTLINSIFMILIYSWVHISKPIYMDYVI